MYFPQETAGFTDNDFGIPIVLAQDLNTTDNRLMKAQTNALTALSRYKTMPILFDATPRPKLTEMLRTCMTCASLLGIKHFGFSNGDCWFTKNPMDYTVDGGDNVVGFRRTEIPSREICGGVDAYIFPVETWRRIYEATMPEGGMYVGGTHIDWWLTRWAQKNRCYTEVIGALEHYSHERSATSKGESPEGQHNLRVYNAWANKHGVSTSP